MTTAMQGFVTTPARMAEKRLTSARCQDFREIQLCLAPEPASRQARRCAQCGVPFCQYSCPLHNAIPDWLALTAQGRLAEASLLLSDTNPLPEICGRICPQDRLCEGACTLEQAGHASVTIGAIERFIADTAWENGWIEPIHPGPERELSVGIIGSGPAGIAAAEVLRQAGYGVTLYERQDRLGGLLTYGIPGFKLEKETVARRLERLLAAGVVAQTGITVGQDTSLTSLRQRHGAILLATGATRPQPFSLPGDDLEGIVPALDYLIASNRKGFGDPVPDFESGRLDAAGKDVVVIGGGDTAMDCLRTAIRQGARSATCLYRRDQANMPGSPREVRHAQDEGAVFHWLAAPERFLGQGTLRGVRAQRIHLGIADSSGRQVPQPIPGSCFTLACDMAITALGFTPEDLASQLDEPGLATGKHGTLLVDPQTGMTSAEGIFAAGDNVRGPSLVVWAIRDGRTAAQGMIAWLAERPATLFPPSVLSAPPSCERLSP